MSSLNSETVELPEWWLLADKEFPQPDWERLYGWVEISFDPEARDAEFMGIARRWVAGICEQLGDGYRVRESEHFMLVSLVPEEKQTELLVFLEQCYVQICAALPCLVEEQPEGKCPVLVIADHSRFYDYLDDFVGDGSDEYAAVGGVFLNRGWGHFAVPSSDLRQYRNVFSHELCHALLSPLRLPVWLDEAITMTVEDSVTKTNPYILDREIIEKHQEYWDEERIQGFWTGESFCYTDDGQGLSYHLAQFVLNALYQGGSTPPGLINDFILAAGASNDAGFQAAQDVLGFDIGELLDRLLGSGNWFPMLVPTVGD
ncbi:MAG: hypothetical protein ACI9UA_001663 [Pseudoalteromonas tetraodonis]